MIKTLLVALVSLTAIFNFLNGQEIKPEEKGYTAFTLIPVGERPILRWVPDGKGGFMVDPKSDYSGFPPGVLYYKQPPSVSEKTSEKKDPYVAMPIVLGMATPWEYIIPHSRSVNLLEMSKTADGVPIYKDYTTIKFPENSRGGIVFLWQRNVKNWDNPNQLIIPLETFVDQTTMTPQEGILVVNTLPSKIAYIVGGSKGILSPGGKAFISVTDPTATVDYQISVEKNGGWVSMTKSKINLQKDCILFFYTYKNLHNPQRNAEKLSFRWLVLPKLPQPEKPPVPQQK